MSLPGFDAVLRPFLEPRDTPPRPPAPYGLGGLERVRAAAPRHVAEALPFLSMSMDVFQIHGALMEVRVPWLAVTLWLVPTEQDVVVLMAEGVTRGRIWTAMELMELMAITERAPAAVKTITHAKLEMDGEIAEVRAR